MFYFNTQLAAIHKLAAIKSSAILEKSVKRQKTPNIPQSKY